MAEPCDEPPQRLRSLRVAVVEQGRVVRIESTRLITASSSHTSAIQIHVRAGLRERALRTLEASGFAARLNGVGLDPVNTREYLSADASVQHAMFAVVLQIDGFS